METKRNELYSFGRFVLNPAERCLVKDEAPVSLTPKAFELLVVLVENNGRLLTKEELMGRIWPDAFVEEANLTQNISTLRKALGENNCIETVPKLGYRFNSIVSKAPYILESVVVEEYTKSQVIIETSSDDQSESVTKMAAALRSRHRLLVAIGLGAAALIIVAGTARFYLNRSGRTPPRSTVRDKVEVWSNEQGEVNEGGVFSPNGRSTAYSKLRNGYQKIWIKQASALQPVQATTELCNDWTPIWKDDGEEIAFISDRERRTAIWIAPSRGGAPRFVTTIDTGGFTPFLKWWSKDGERIYYELRSNLYVFEINTQTARQISDFDPKLGPYKTFSVSRDEKLIAYTDSVAGRRDIWVTPMNSWNPVRVTDDDVPEINLVWHPDGKRIVYTVLVGGKYEVYEGYLDGSPPLQILPGASNQMVTDVSNDGLTMCVAVTEGASSLWVLKVEEDKEFEIPVGAGVVLWPQAGPSGDRVVFQTNDSMDSIIESSVIVAPTERDGQMRQVAVNGLAATWSPDGERIAFLRYDKTRYEICLVSQVGDGERQITHQGVSFSGYMRFPVELLETVSVCWSPPDGKYLAFCSRREKVKNVWTASADGSEERQVSDNADPNTSVSCPLFSPDGSRIAFASTTKSENGVLYSFSVASDSQVHKVYQSPCVTRLLGWSQSGNGLILAQHVCSDEYPDKPTDVDVFEAKLGPANTSTVVKRLESTQFRSLRLSSDGRYVAFVSSRDLRNAIELLTMINGSVRALTKPGEQRTYYAGLAWSRDGRNLFFTKQTANSRLIVMDGLK